MKHQAAGEEREQVSGNRRQFPPPPTWLRPLQPETLSPPLSCPLPSPAPPGCLVSSPCPSPPPPPPPPLPPLFPPPARRRATSANLSDRQESRSGPWNQ